METQIETISVEALPERMRDIVAIHTSAYAEWNGPRTAEQEESKARGYLRKWSAFLDPVFLLASVGESAVGYLSAEERRGTIHIAHIGVQKEHERQGVGRSLLEATGEHAKSRHCAAVTTTTYNRYRGMLILLLKQRFYIQGTSWVQGATDLQILLRKDLM